MLAPAYVDGLPLGPEFRSDFLGYFPESLVTIFAEIVDGDVLSR